MSSYSNLTEHDLIVQIVQLEQRRHAPTRALLLDLLYCLRRDRRPSRPSRRARTYLPRPRRQRIATAA